MNTGPVPDTPFTRTTTLPVIAPPDTSAVMLVSLQYGTVLAVVPANSTVLPPCVPPNPLPVIVTTVPTGPDVGQILVTPGPPVTVNHTPLLAAPPTVTTTLPAPAPAGTATVMLVSRQSDAIPALTLPNVTVLPLCAAPNPLPVIVTAVPTAPDVTERLVMLGPAPVTVKLAALLVPPLVVTVTSAAPVAAFAAIVNVAVICVSLTTVTPLTAIPALLTATLAPGAKSQPASVTENAAPGAPLAGLTVFNVGAGYMFVRLKIAGAATPSTLAVTVYAPATGSATHHAVAAPVPSVAAVAAYIGAPILRGRGPPARGARLGVAGLLACALAGAQFASNWHPDRPPAPETSPPHPPPDSPPRLSPWPPAAQMACRTLHLPSGSAGCRLQDRTCESARSASRPPGSDRSAQHNEINLEHRTP